MTDVNYVTELNFQDEVIGATLPVLVDFTATWCQPCKMIDPIVKQLAGYGYEGWFVVEAEQDPVKSPPLKMAQIGYKELMRVMTLAGYTVVA